MNVGRWLAAHGFPVPALYADRAREDGLLLLEDVGDTTLWAAVAGRRRRATRPLFAAPSICSSRCRSRARASRRRAASPSARRFDGALARAELEHFVDHGIETRHGTTLAADERATLLAELAPLRAPFVDGPFVLSHRDYMAWNIHVQDGALRLIDFQDALLAPDAFDLAQLLTDRTTDPSASTARSTTRWSRASSAAMARRRACRVADGFADRYHRCALQHALKVIGRFYSSRW